jgi:hypothetical protein
MVWLLSTVYTVNLFGKVLIVCRDTSVPLSFQSRFVMAVPEVCKAPLIKDYPLTINGKGPMMNGESPMMNGEGPMMNGEGPMMKGEGPMMNGKSPTINGRSPTMNGDHSKYTVSETSLGTPRHLRIIIIGAGASGLNMSRHLEQHMTNIEQVVYEKNADVGGTWFENKYVYKFPNVTTSIRICTLCFRLIRLTHPLVYLRYPGCACDIPSHNYQYTWAPNYDWSY